MNDWLANLVEQIRALPPQRQLVLLAAGVGSLSFLYWISSGIGAPDYRSLYRGLAEEDMARVTDALTGEKIDYRLDDGGSSVLVPASDLYEARIRIASKGLPGGGSSGFEIFDRPAFGVTDFVHRVNYTRAVQGELARSVEQLEPIARARVQVVIPERKSVLASRERKPSASVVVRLVPGRDLDSNQARAIVHLIASSIESLEPKSVTVVDTTGRLLAPLGDTVDGSMQVGGATGHQARVEADLSRRVESMLEPVVGPGGVVARVRAEMDWTKSEVTEERFDPNSQVARSEQRTTETETARSEGGVPGVAANATAEGSSGAGPSGPESNRLSEVFNYEISKTVSHRTTPMGQIKRLSVAVLVDSSASEGAEGEPAPQEWEPEALNRLEQLAMQAVGFSEERGDKIVVSSAPFRAPELEIGADPTLDPQMINLITKSVTVLAQLAALLLFAQLIVRPLLGSVSDPARQGQLPTTVSALEMEMAGAGGGTGAPALPDVPLTLAEQVGAEAQARSEDSLTTIRTWLNQG